MATTASIPAYLLPGVAVHQPPHLEGDASLATEILPGPPSSASMQQNALKRDPKKPSMAYSYLPPSDPGSTYSGLTAGTLIGQDPEGPRSKRSRIDKGATGRAQRASARSHGANAGPGPVPSTSDLPIEAEAMADLPLDSAAVDSDSGGPGVEREPSISRSSSSGNMLDPPPQPSDPAAAVRPRRKDKGKGKEVEDVPSRVKEEPKASLLNPQESPPSNLLNNEDHCSSCRSFGSLVYCDGCPRAFHLWCLDPPVESLDDDARWFCSTCKARKHPPRKPPTSLFSPLLQQLQTSNPVEFSLPEDIRTFFKDVVSGPKGNYMDGSGVKAPRLNRHGQLEDRDPHRLRDRNGGPVLCFQCGSSALPNSLTANPPTAKRPRRSTSTAPAPDAWKGIVSCDYCNLHWHMDCVDPPLLTMPPLNKKWMCPNHAERVMPHKRRIPRQNASAIEITKPGQFNNGNIDVIQPELSTAVPHRHMPADEVLINGRRYRVPERVIVLDFWNKLNKYDEHLHMEPEMASGVSSPLTSLSSLDDDDRSLPSGAHSEVDELVAAQLLCSLSVPRRAEPSDTRGSTAHLNGRASQPEKAVTSLTPKNKVGRPRKYPLAHKLATHTAARHGIASRSSESANTSSSVTISTSKRKRPSQQVAPESSSRELRSRSRTNHADIPLTATSSRETLMPEETTTKTRSFNVKTEDAELSPFSNPSSVANQATTASSIAKPVRAPRQPKPKDSDSSVKEPKEKRGKKRKSREDEAPSGTVRENGKASLADAPKTTKGAQTAESARTPIRPSQLQASNQGTPPTSSVGPVNSPSTLATPSLKIRLPRLSNLTGKKTLASAHIDTPTSLS